MPSLLQTGFGMFSARAGRGRTGCAEKRILINGSAFLLAAGTGEPVGDATTTIHLPKGGTYRVWVRNRNWLKDYSPGQFRLAIN